MVSAFFAVTAQAAAAVVIVLLMYGVTLLLLRQGRLVSSELQKGRQNVVLAPGPLDNRSPLHIGTSLNVNRQGLNSVQALLPSNNLSGGDQFTLSFFLKLANDDPVDQCILLWGDKSYATFKMQGSNTETIQHLLVFMPMIRLRLRTNEAGRQVYTLTVHYNTSAAVRTTCEGDMDGEGTVVDARRDNLVTVCFSDYNRLTSSFGCECVIYVNENEVARRVTPGATIVRNAGHIYVNPRTDIDVMRGGHVGNNEASSYELRDLSYHNFAFKYEDILAKLRGKLVYDGTEGSQDVAQTRLYDAVQDLTSHNIR